MREKHWNSLQPPPPPLSRLRLVSVGQDVSSQRGCTYSSKKPDRDGSVNHEPLGGEAVWEETEEEEEEERKQLMGWHRPALSAADSSVSRMLAPLGVLGGGGV